MSHILATKDPILFNNSALGRIRSVYRGGIIHFLLMAGAAAAELPIITPGQPFVFMERIGNTPFIRTWSVSFMKDEPTESRACIINARHVSRMNQLEDGVDVTLSDGVNIRIGVIGWKKIGKERLDAMGVPSAEVVAQIISESSK